MGKRRETRLPAAGVASSGKEGCHAKIQLRQLDGGRGHLAEAVQDVQHHGAGALHFAAWCKKVEVCEYLVEDVQVDVDAVDQAGKKPLVWAITADKSGYVNIFRYLLDHGANPDNVDIIGFTPLHEAAKIEVLMSIHFLQIMEPRCMSLLNISRMQP
uniref:Uncharacterized protein n=1 Tax=Triticum urartu TaxID=4572 RepID=A0A8R7PUL9_TRIUA